MLNLYDGFLAEGWGGPVIIAAVETAPLVLDIGVVLLVAASFGWLSRRLGLPAVIGYLVAGLTVSPFTPGYVADDQQLQVLADVGVILLLFEVGIEIDLRRIGREQGALLWAAPLQVLLGVAIGAPILLAVGQTPLAALLMALGVAMSSSVVIVNITRSRRRSTNPGTEQALLGWSVLQDLTGVAVGAIVLAVFGASDRPIGLALGGLVGFLVLAWLAAKLLPRLLRQLRWEHDLFLIVSVSVGLALAAVGAVVFGMPLALAAFVAGLAVNQGRDTDEVRRVLLPFRDLFAVLFFIVIGTLIDPTQLTAALPKAALLLVLMLVLKTLLVALLAKLAGIKVRRRQLAIGLSQVGEFSFVLGSAALAAGAMSRSDFVAVLVTVVVTIAGSTLAVRTGWAAHR